MGIADKAVVCVAPCLGDCSQGRGLGGAVPWGIAAGVSRGWRRVLGIADKAVVWVAPCLGDCSQGRGLGGAVPWGLLVGPCLGDC